MENFFKKLVEVYLHYLKAFFYQTNLLTVETFSTFCDIFPVHQ